MEITLSDAYGVPTCTSKQVADHFGKRHDNVLQSLRDLIAAYPAGHALKIDEMIFEGVVQEVRGKGAVVTKTAYHLTKNGFTLLAMGFTGTEALRLKLDYIAEFDALTTKLALTQNHLQLSQEALYKRTAAACHMAGNHLLVIHGLTSSMRDTGIRLAVIQNYGVDGVTCDRLNKAEGNYDRHHFSAAKNIVDQARANQVEWQDALDALPKPETKTKDLPNPKAKPFDEDFPF